MIKALIDINTLVVKLARNTARLHDATALISLSVSIASPREYVLAKKRGSRMNGSTVS